MRINSVFQDYNTYFPGKQHFFRKNGKFPEDIFGNALFTNPGNLVIITRL